MNHPHVEVSLRNALSLVPTSFTLTHSARAALVDLHSRVTANGTLDVLSPAELAWIAALAVQADIYQRFGPGPYAL